MSDWHIWGHITATVSWLASVFGSLPALAATMAASVAIIWYTIQIWESHTTQSWVARWRARRLAARVASLEKRKRQVIAELDTLKPVDTTSIPSPKVEAHGSNAGA